jgi:hypothetical protein
MEKERFCLYYIKNTVRIYMNPTRDRDKKSIFNDNNKKAGIYMFTNKLNNKQYIGSAINLNKRISAYF